MMHDKATQVDSLDVPASVLPVCDVISTAKLFFSLCSLLGRRPVLLVPFLRPHPVVMVKPLRYKQMEVFPSCHKQ